MTDKFYESMSKKELYESWIFFEKAHKKSSEEVKYYREELAKAHELLGRVIHQNSERWDSVRLTKYYSTNNLHNNKGKDNA